MSHSNGVRADGAGRICPHEDVHVEGLVVLDGVNDTGARPSANSMVRILRLEPGRQGSRVRTSNHDPVSLVPENLVLAIDKVGDIGEGLLGSEELKVVRRPVVKGL